MGGWVGGWVCFFFFFLVCVWWGEGGRRRGGAVAVRGPSAGCPRVVRGLSAGCPQRVRSASAARPRAVRLDHMGRSPMAFPPHDLWGITSSGQVARQRCTSGGRPWAVRGLSAGCLRAVRGPSAGRAGSGGLAIRCRCGEGATLSQQGPFPMVLFCLKRIGPTGPPVCPRSSCTVGARADLGGKSLVRW